jgi:hypothetical protein
MIKIIALLMAALVSGAGIAQNVGIGTSNPKARLHVTDSSVAFSANGLAMPAPGNTPVTGAGRRMMWYADKAAFRVGYTGGTDWDRSSTGNYSFAAGYGPVASGDYAVAMGLNTRAAGLSSIALGNNAQATTDFSTAIGAVSFANGLSATSVGFQVFATGAYSTALGYNNVSRALGGTVVGMFNDASDAPDPNDTSSLDRIFQIGNGYYDANIDDEVRRNAVTVLRNGNMGIGTATPGFPLNFSSTVGDKISLFGNTSAHYGLGIQNALLQIHTDAAGSAIAFGYGSSSNFTERARIINAGTDGMMLKGRMHLRNGTAPLDINQTPGIWLYKADNSAALGFMGTENNQNIGFFGGPLGWGFRYDAVNSRVGIGISNPSSLLDVNGQLIIEQKNFGGYGGLLIKGNIPGSNYPNIAFTIKNNAGTPADVVSGLIQGDIISNTSGGETMDLSFFTSASGLGGLAERLRLKSNGAIAINGSTGTDKQILMSNSNTGAPAWTTVGNIIQTFSSGATPLLQLTGTAAFDLPQATLNFTVTVPSRILLYPRCNTWKVCIAGACQTKWKLEVFLNGNLIKTYGVDGVRYAAENSSPGSDITLGPEFIDVNPGIYSITFKGTNSFNEPYVTFSSAAMIIPR